MIKIYKMISWNSPYVLAVLLGLLAVSLFYFDQKQKKEETPKLSYVKVFTLTTGLILAFNYFADNSLTDVVEAISNPINPINSVIEKPTASQAPSTNYTYQSQNGGNSGGMYGNLKIREGPPDF